MTYKYATFFKWITVIIDYMLLNLALYISFVIEYSGTSFMADASGNFGQYALLLNLLWFYASSLVKLYENILVREAIPTIKATIIALLIYLTIPLFLTFTFIGINFSLQFIVNSFILFSTLIFFGKISFLSIRKSRRRFWIEYKKVVIVGAGKVGRELYHHIMANSNLGYKVEGMFDDDLNTELEGSQRLLGSVKDCFSYAVANNVSEVFCALPGNDLEKIKLLMEESDHHMIRFRLVPDLKSFFDKNVMLELYGHMPILTPRKEPLENKANEIIKRAFDVLFSSLVIVLILSWVVPIIAIIIKFDSKGPVFFKQLRSGKGNKPFYCYKFRSMSVNADSDRNQATKGDLRITRVGAILRKTSLDELPQFFNVLLGEMSVVGPRPHMLKHTQDYSILINNFMVRHFLTPGITGWAQVKGYRGETRETRAMAQRVEADIWYLENWSILLDVKIIFLTIWQVVRGSDNAY
jgi:putative colanic acid biosysnthesis UDP-glucose lipid carrier transferase